MERNEVQNGLYSLVIFSFFFAFQTNSVKAEAAQRRRVKSLYAISELGRKT